ncbi:class I SAM-dependent methyltransferase [candidate division KSB1 bacterium]|nr:class I SAM-dependent methyltransferase [candidate division KSB1 bacterium]
MEPHLEKIFFELHTDLPREGPGDFESTKKAYQLLKDLPKQPLILDIGCGPGKQVLDLIKITDGKIIAVDNYQPYIDRLNANAASQGLQHRIQAQNGDMFNLQFAEHSFDVLWAEGSIYIIGFERGLQTFQPFLKKRGYLSVTEISWLKPNRPAELTEFWDKEYPPMQSFENNLQIIKKSGLKLIDHFVLPEHAWMDDYYIPLEKRIDLYKAKFRDNPEVLEFLAFNQLEIDLYRKYSDYFGYVFYVMQKI